MKLILDFVYFGEVDVSLTDVSSVIETARLLQIPCLSDFPSTISEKSSLSRSCDGTVCDIETNSFVDVIKCEESHSIVQDAKLICNKDIHEENECQLTANNENVCDSKTHSGSILKIISGTLSNVPMKGNDDASVTKIIMNNERKENVQYSLTPFAFVAVSPYSANSEHGDEELNDSCSTRSDVESPLEGNRKISGTTKEVKMESDFEVESKVKKEIEEDDDIYETDDDYESMEVSHISYGLDSSTLKNNENICEKESTQNIRLIETVGCDSSKSSFGDGTEKLEVECESIYDILKLEYSEGNPMETHDENESVDDNNDFSTSNQRFESLGCETETIGLSNFPKYLTHASGFPNTERLKMKRLSLDFERINCCFQRKADNNYAAFHESPSPSRCCTQPTAQESHLERSKDTDGVQCEYVGSEKRFNITEYVDNATCTRKERVRKSRNNSSELKLFSCNVCDRSFHRNDLLKKHKCINAVKKQFLCDICNASFGRKYYLMLHMRTHTADKPFKCDICDTTFSRNDHLKRHKRTHEGIKPYKCDHCGASFSENGNLKKHKRIHDGIRPFKCDDCGISFSENGNLKKHKRIHAGIRPFKCDDCGISFSENIYLKRHKNRKHTDQV